MYNIYLVPESLALKIPALMGLGSVEPGLRKTQAAGPKEKKTVSGGKNSSLVPLIQLLQSFNKVSIVFVTCLVFCSVKFFLVYCPVSWWWQQPLVHHEFRRLIEVSFVNCPSDNMDSISVILSQVFFSFFFF